MTRFIRGRLWLSVLLPALGVASWAGAQPAVAVTGEGVVMQDPELTVPQAPPADFLSPPVPLAVATDPLTVFPAQVEHLDTPLSMILQMDLRLLLTQVYAGALTTVVVDPSVEGRVDASVQGMTYRELLPLLFDLYQLELRPLSERVYLIAPRTDPAPAPGAAAWPRPNAGAQAAQEEEPSPDAEFQIRLMAEPQDRDHIEVDYVPLETASGRVHLPMHRRVLCTGADVVRAQLQEEEGRVSVLLLVNEAAGARLRRATGGNLGKQLALVYRGQLVAAPTIRDEVSRDIVVSGTGPEWPELARTMVQTLSGAQ
jgi:hypothetical protein